MKLITGSIFIFSLSLLVNLCECARPTGSSQTPSPLYNIKNVGSYSRWCTKSSIEAFFDKIAEPSVTLLYHRGKALFGILMDKIEASYDDDTEALEKTRQQWEFISKTVTSSLDSALDRLETEWAHFILLHDTKPLPWEDLYKTTLIYEVLGGVEYGYMMIEAVIRSGVKEIVGTLQHQLVHVIRTLEDEISKTSSSGEDVTELKLLKQMKRGLSKMRPSFTTKLLEKVVMKALKGQKSESSSPHSKVKQNFISETMDEMALVVHAFREKGSHFPNFWTDISLILNKEKSDMNDEVSIFIQELLQNQEALIDTVIQIISRDNKTNL